MREGRHTALNLTIRSRYFGSNRDYIAFLFQSTSSYGKYLGFWGTVVGAEFALTFSASRQFQFQTIQNFFIECIESCPCSEDENEGCNAGSIGRLGKIVIFEYYLTLKPQFSHNLLVPFLRHVPLSQW